MAKFCSECGSSTVGGTFCCECGARYAEPVLPRAHTLGPEAPSSAPPSHGGRPPAAASARMHTDSSVSSESASNPAYRRVQSEPPAHQPVRVLKGRYADHPNCDVCGIGFDVTKRRHQCRRCGLYICSSCSPLRLLIPWGQQLEGARGYDKCIPQRVCLRCAPELHPVQDELVSLYAHANDANEYEAKGRLHLPFTTSLAKECQNAADIIGNFFRNEWGASTDRGIPVALLQKAQGLAVMSIVKAGFIVVGKIGTGLVLSRLPDDSWSAPSAIGTIGLGGGFEIGGEVVDVMIILGSQGAVDVFQKPQVNLGAGLDIAIGPYGRSAAAAAALSTSGINANYSYSHSKGLYAGISLQGSVIVARNDLNRKFYGRDLSPAELLNGSVPQPRAAEPLYTAINGAMGELQVHRDIVAQRSALMGVCRLCSCSSFDAHAVQVWNKKCKNCDHVH